MANLLSVNLLAPILLVQALLPMMTPGERVIFVGSTSGLDNFGCPEVANTASKFGLRGAAQALAGCCILAWWDLRSSTPAMWRQRRLNRT